MKLEDDPFVGDEKGAVTQPVVPQNSEVTPVVTNPTKNNSDVAIIQILDEEI